MRILKVITVILLVHLFYACNKDKGLTQEKTANYAISTADTLEHSLGFFGDEEGVSIQLQASHYQISELIRDINTEKIIYRYKADSTYVGNDYIELQSARGSDGASPGNDIIITKVIIKVE